VYKQGQARVKKASVTIVFDNTDQKESPAGYEDYQELTVTRMVREISCVVKSTGNWSFWTLGISCSLEAFTKIWFPHASVMSLKYTTCAEIAKFRNLK
jgi:hypothetical protein